MHEQRNIHLAEIPYSGIEGFMWNRLHGEREELCERILKDHSDERRKKLQVRLRKVDDALDRLMGKGN
jgi:hypothetical protein